MKMNPTILVNNLKRIFYVLIAVQIIVFIGIAFKWISLPTITIELSVAYERYILLITLLGIPGALKLYSKISNSNKTTQNVEQKISTYQKAFATRFGILFFIATLNIVSYALSYSQNFMLLTLITFTAYIFSYPSLNYFDETKAQDNE